MAAGIRPSRCRGGAYNDPHGLLGKGKERDGMRMDEAHWLKFA